MPRLHPKYRKENMEQVDKNPPPEEEEPHDSEEVGSEIEDESVSSEELRKLEEQGK